MALLVTRGAQGRSSRLRHLFLAAWLVVLLFEAGSCFAYVRAFVAKPISWRSSKITDPVHHYAETGLSSSIRGVANRPLGGHESGPHRYAQARRASAWSSFALVQVGYFLQLLHGDSEACETFSAVASCIPRVLRDVTGPMLEYPQLGYRTSPTWQLGAALAGSQKSKGVVVALCALWSSAITLMCFLFCRYPTEACACTVSACT